MRFNSLIPELSVTDLEVSKKFYLTLGFQIKYERKEDNFCFLQMGRNQLMIEQINDHWSVGKLTYPFGNGVNFSMRVSNVEKYYQKLKKKNIKFFKELMINSYRVGDTISEDIEFLIQDPDGYLLRFNN